MIFKIFLEDSLKKTKIEKNPNNPAFSQIYFNYPEFQTAFRSNKFGFKQFI